MIKTIRKKLLSGILTLAIVLSLLPAATLSVSAAADFTGTIAPNGEWTKTISDVYADCKSKITGYDNVYFSNLVTDGGVADNAHVYLNGASTQYLDQDMGFGGNADATAYDGTETMKFTASSPGTYSFDIYSFDTETTKHFQITVTGAATAPTVTATGGNPTFTQGGSSGVDLFSLVTAATNDSGQTFTGATLTVSNVSDTSEYLTIGGTDIALINGGSGSLSNGTYNVTVTGGTATITLSGMTLSDAQMGTLIDGVTYKDTAASVTQGNREVKITSVTDSGSSSNTVSPNITATVNVTKLATAANSTVTASKTLITADGTSTSTITVTLKDTNGNVVSGKTVTLAQGSGSSTITAVSGTTNASGQATFTVKSTKAEAVTYTATDTTDSVTVTPTATVTFTAGTPTAGNSTVSAAPTSVEADGTTTSTITVTLKDTNSNPVSGKTVTLAAGSGSSTITTVSDTTDSKGQATFAVKETVHETVT